MSSSSSCLSPRLPSISGQCAADQFESTLAFSVRQEEAPAPSALFGAFAGFTSQTASDTDVLYAYLDSGDLVARVDADVGLRAAYSLPRAQDPVFAFDPSGTIEDLTRYWRRMTRVAYDPGTGLIEIRVRAFDAASAKAIAEAGAWRKHRARERSLGDRPGRTRCAMPRPTSPTRWRR